MRGVRDHGDPDTETNRPRGRVGAAAAVVALALGVALLMFAPLLRFWVYPRVALIPLDQKSTIVAVAHDATVFNPELLSTEQVPLLTAVRTIRGDPWASVDTPKVAVWNQTLCITRDDAAPAEPIAADTGTCRSGRDAKSVEVTTDRIAFDRRSGEAVASSTASVNGDKSVRHVGLGYTFPLETERRTYGVFDTVARRDFPARFMGTETVAGLRVYRFLKDSVPAQIGTQDVPGTLIGRPSQRSVTAARWYSDQVTFWVEPVTGVIVRGEERQTQTLRGSDDTDAVTLLDADFVFDDSTVARQAALASDGRGRIRMLTLIGPIVFGLAGLGLVVIGLLQIRRRPLSVQPPISTPEQGWVTQER
jgi:hypothetical protein